MTPLFAFLFLQAGGSGMASLLMMAAIFGVFYFLLIMPQQKRQKKWQAMLSELKAGDKVTTSGVETVALPEVEELEAEELLLLEEGK